MSDVDIFRRKADELLKLATSTADLGERSRLVSEATHWHMKAVEAEEAGRTGEPRARGEATPATRDPLEPEAF